MSKTNKKSIVFGLGVLAIFAFGLMSLPTLAMAAPTYVYGHDNADGTYTFGDFAWGKSTSTNEISNPVPNVSSINPKSSNVGVGTKTITITGSGFVSNSVARVNGSNRPTTFIDASHLLVQITGNDTSAYRTNGGFFITVFNGTPGGGYSNAAFFTINTVVAPITNTNNNNSPDTFTDTTQTQTGNTVNTDPNANGNYSNLASNAIFGSNSFLPSGLIQWVLFAIIILIIVIIVRKIFGGRERYDEEPMKHA
jgi:hypothetical protein